MSCMQSVPYALCWIGLFLDLVYTLPFPWHGHWTLSPCSHLASSPRGSWEIQRISGCHAPDPSHGCVVMVSQSHNALGAITWQMAVGPVCWPVNTAYRWTRLSCPGPIWYRQENRVRLLVRVPVWYPIHSDRLLGQEGVRGGGVRWAGGLKSWWRCFTLAYFLIQQKSLSLNGGFAPCRHLRPSSGREHSHITYSARWWWLLDEWN